MNPFQRLPNEIIDTIFIHLHPSDVLKFQQCSASSDQLLDSHLRSRRYAVDELMFFGCKHGNNQAVRKAVSLGADVDILAALPEHSWEILTLLQASDHVNTASLLFDLGARLDVHCEGIPDMIRKEFERRLSPEFFQLCLDRGTTDQFEDFQDRIDHSLFQHLQTAIDSALEGFNVTVVIGKISAFLEMGANPITDCSDPHGYYSGSSLSELISWLEPEYLHPGHFCHWILSIMKLMLSKHPDINAHSMEMTRRFLEDRTLVVEGESGPCPILQATIWMAEYNSTLIMDMLLEAGARLDLPVHTSFHPLFIYARTAFESRNSRQGYEYLCSHGARIEPTWHPGESVEDCDSIPIFRLWHYWAWETWGECSPLSDMEFETTKLFIEQGAVKNVGLRFIKNALRPLAAQLYDARKPFFVIYRSHILLELILHQDDNLNPNIPAELDDLLLEVVEQTTIYRPGNSDLRFSNIIDPLLVALLLQKGAKLRTRSRTKEFRDHAVSQLQRDPYNIRIDI